MVIPIQYELKLIDMNLETLKDKDKKHIDLKPIKNAWKAAGVALGALFTAVALLGGGPLVHGAPVECMNSSVLSAEVGEDEKPSNPPEQLYGT